MAEHQSPKHLRTVKSFVKRSGRITKRQQHAIKHYSTLYQIPYAAEQIDLMRQFDKPQPLIVEIGFGMGTSLVEMAKNHPEQNYLGIEVHAPGIGNILDLIHKNKLDNLKIIADDATCVFKNGIAENSLSGIQIFFPDPWHKKRHHKRRLVNRDFLSLMVSRLKAQGVIHFASDWRPYAEAVMTLFLEHPALKNNHQNYAPRPKARPLTKFETRGRNLEHEILDIIFTKLNH